MNTLPPHPRSPERLGARLLDAAEHADASTTDNAVQPMASPARPVRLPLLETALRTPAPRSYAPLLLATPGLLLTPLLIALGAGTLPAVVAGGLGFAATAATLNALRQGRHLRRRAAELDLARATDALASQTGDLPPAVHEAWQRALSLLGGLLAASPDAVARGELLPEERHRIARAVRQDLPAALRTLDIVATSARSTDHPPWMTAQALCLQQLDAITRQLQAVNDALTQARLQRAARRARFLSRRGGADDTR